MPSADQASVVSTTPTHPAIHPALETVLRENRASFNQRFRAVSAEGQPLDIQSFQAHIRHRISPIIAAVNATFPEKVRPVANELYDVSLQLFRAGYFGVETKLIALERLWCEVLPKLAIPISREPTRVVGSLTNSLIQLSKEPGFRTQQWLENLSVVAPFASSASELLDVNVVLAWRSGAAFLRNLALQQLEHHSSRLGSIALDLRDADDLGGWSQLIDQLKSDRWYHPRLDSQSNPPRPQIVTKVGAFRGYSGDFTGLPRVVLHDGQLMVHDGSHLWQIHADRFGAGLRKNRRLETRDPLISAAQRASLPSLEARIEPNGRLLWKGQSFSFPTLSASSSQAFDGQTLAVTLPTSFHVYLLAFSSQPLRHCERTNR